MSTANCSTYEPSSKELIAEIGKNSAAIVLLVLESVFCLVTILMFFEACFYINKKIADSRTRVRLIVIIGIYPVYSSFSLLALYVPKAHLITHLSSTLYFSVALFQFLMLIVGYFGGREELLKKLKDVKMPIASPPLLCCFPCIPGAQMTGKNLLSLKRIVLQVVFIRPACNFIALILWADGTYIPGMLTADSAFVWLTVVALCSSLVALYGVIILMRISHVALPGYHVKPKFFLVQLVLVLVTGQLLILAILAMVGVIPCDYPLSSSARSYYISDLLVVMEMLIFIVFARFFFRKRISNTPPRREHHVQGAYASMSSDQDVFSNQYGHLPSVTSLGSNDTNKMEAGHDVNSNAKCSHNNNGSYFNHGVDMPNGKSTMLEDVKEEAKLQEEFKKVVDHHTSGEDNVFIEGDVTQEGDTILDEKL